MLAFGEALTEVYRRWGHRAWTWHEAADTVRFHPPLVEDARDGLVWIGNWGDGERTAELEAFLLAPARAAGLPLDIYGVRYPAEAQALVARYGASYRGWLANAAAPAVFARHLATVHVPRRFYTTMLPGIPTIRVFEALACGIPLVSAPWDDAEGLFRPGRLPDGGRRRGDDAAADRAARRSRPARHHRRRRPRDDPRAAHLRPPRRRAAGDRRRPRGARTEARDEERRVKIAFYGSSLVSSYWNGAATYYRGILGELARRGHAITFYEPDAFDRQAHRDIDAPDWCRSVVYPATADGLASVLAEAGGADVVVKASGVGVFDRELLEGVVARARPGALQDLLGRRRRRHARRDARRPRPSGPCARCPTSTWS